MEGALSNFCIRFWVEKKMLKSKEHTSWDTSIPYVVMGLLFVWFHLGKKKQKILSQLMHKHSLFPNLKTKASKPFKYNHP